MSLQAFDPYQKLKGCLRFLPFKFQKNIGVGNGYEGLFNRLKKNNVYLNNFFSKMIGQKFLKPDNTADCEVN